MVKNRKTKAAARNLKKESGITYPRALDLVAPAGRDGNLPGYRIAGACWSPAIHRNLWIQAGAVGDIAFEDITAQVQADPAAEVSAYDFTQLTVNGPESDAAALQETLEAVRTAAPGRSRIIIVSGRHKLRTSLEGDRLINLITEMSAEHACTFILLGGPMPAIGHWSRHFTTNVNGELREHLIHGHLLHSAGDHHRPLQYQGVLLGTGFHDDEMRVIGADFGVDRTLLVTGVRRERSDAAHSIARSSGYRVWDGSLDALAQEVRDRVKLASDAGEYTVRALPEPPEPIVLILNLDWLGGTFALFSKMMRDAFRANVFTIATARSARSGRNMLPGPVSMTVNIDRGEADVVGLGGVRTRFNSFWHFEPPAPDPKQMALNAEARKTDRSRTSERRPVRKIGIEPGDELRFHGTRTVFSARAVSENFVVATGSERGKPVYTILDWEDGVRGGHNSWGYGAVTDEEIAVLIKTLETSRSLRAEAESNPLSGTNEHPWPLLELELSARSSVYLDLKSVRRGRKQVWPQQ